MNVTESVTQSNDDRPPDPSNVAHGMDLEEGEAHYH